MTQEKPKIRLFTDSRLHADAVKLSGNQSHYVTNVMRADVGDVVRVFNGIDGEWLATINTLGKKQVTLSLIRQIKKQSPSPDLWLAFAPIKNKTELVVEKATELGAAKIIPVLTRYSVVKSINKEKLMANAVEAAEQCERLDVPVLEECVGLSHLLAAWPVSRILLHADESGAGEPLNNRLLPHIQGNAVGVLIGPEGGFSKEEQQLLKSKSFVRPFTLGPRILRADTAAVAALACVQAWLGDWEQKPNFHAQG
jgi:16S rRNA (uracil1498-N3)-methyltransferase